MGRYLARQGGEPIPSSTPYSNNVPTTDPVVGRYIRRNRGEDVPVPQGRYRRFRDVEANFLASEEGLKLQEDIKRQVEESMRLEEERLKGVQQQAEERINDYETATAREQRMFGGAGTSTLQEELKDLGYTDEQIESEDLKGIDIEAVTKYREARADFEAKNGKLATVFEYNVKPFVKEQAQVSAVERGKQVLDGLNTLFLKKTNITAPFQNKLDPDRDKKGPQVYGKLTDWAGEMVTATLDGIVEVVGLTAAETALITKAALDPKTDYKDVVIDNPLSPGWVFSNTKTNDDNKIRPIVERSLDMWSELNEQRPETPKMNLTITVLDQFIIPFLDATVVLDIASLGVKPLIMNTVIKPGVQKYLSRGTREGIESFAGVGTRTVKIPVRTETEQLLTAYQVLGWSRDDIAKIAGMSQEEQAQVFANRMRERASAILKNDYTPTTGMDLAPQQTAPEMLDALNALKKEGSLSPEQEMELYRLNSAVYTVMGMQLKDGVVGIPKMLQFGIEVANVLAKPLRTYADAKYALDRALRLRARAAGEAPFKLNIGLTIDDVSGGAGKKVVSDDVAENIDPIVKKFAEDEYAGIEIAFDSNTNSVLITDGFMRWQELPTAAKAAIIDLAREQKVNLGSVAGVDEFGPQPGEIEFIVRGYSAEEVAINRKIQAMEKSLNEQRKAIEVADEAYVKEGLSPDDPLIQQIANLGVSQSYLVNALDAIPQAATGRTVPNIISRQILNTPIQANITRNPIRRSELPEGNATAKAIIDSNNGLVAQMADQARAVTSAADFVRRYSFLEDVTKVPDVRFRGTGIFNRLGTVEERIRDLVSSGVINREQIDSIKAVELPSEMVEMTPAFREPKLAQALEDGVMPDMVESLVKKGTPENKMIENYLYERYNGLKRITSSQINKPEEVLADLRASEEKPNIPFFVLTNQGKAVLLSTNQPTFDVIAAAKMAGIETIPGYLIDLGGLAELRAFLKENNMNLKDFALEARSFAPKVESGKKAKKPMTAEMREEAGLVSGRLTRVGTSEEFSLVIPSNILVQPFPVNEPVLYNNLPVREQFDLSKMTVISEGSSRVNFEAGKDAILKVAKGVGGQIQNLMAYNMHAWRQGLIPNLTGGGDGWILTEKHGALDGEALKHFEDFIDFYRAYATKNIGDARRPKEIDRILQSWLDGADQTKIDEMLYDAVDFELDMKYMDVYFFNFLNEWRQSDTALTAVTKDGKPIYNWTEFARYNVNLDILKEDSWGVRPDGTLVLIDEGALYREALGALKSPVIKQKEWGEFFNPFQETFKKNKAFKEQAKISDGHRFFSFTPLPIYEQDEETGEYNFDIWKSMAFTALGSVAVGGKELPFGGGKKKKGKKVKGTKTEVEKLRAELLPQTTQGLPGVVKGALNSDAFKAKTGEAFGGVFPQTANFKGVSPQGIPSLDAPGELLPPLGDAGYAFLDNDVAASLNTDGKITNFISNADNPLVLNTDKELRALAKAAGIQEPDIMQVTKAMNKKNIKMLRDYIENAGFDGVVVAMDPRKGKVDLLDRYFEFNQFINFNKGNYKPATSPNTPSVTVTTVLKRSSKIQRQIMRAIDPPKNIIMVDEMKALKKRLQLINRTIKEGRKLGWAEARISIPKRLNNLWENRLIAADRNRELSLLRQRILDREKILIKRELTDYAKMVLKPNEDREYLAQRGKLIDAIANAQTRTELQKAFIRIDRMKATTEKSLLVADIKKMVGRWADSPSVSADYRKMIKEVFSDIDLTSRRADTIQRIAKMRDYINRTISAGDDVVITADMQKELELLFVKGIDQLSVGDLKNFQAKIETLIEFGKAKRRTYKELQRLKKERILREIQEGTTKPFTDKEVQNLPANVGEELTKQEQFNNFWKEQQNILRHTSAVIQPMDYLFDMLDGRMLTFDGPMYRAFRDGVNIRYNNFLSRNFEMTDSLIKISTDLGLKTGNFERIGVFMQARRAEGRARLISMGYTNQMIDDIALTAKETEWMNYVDDLLAKERPILARIARDVFNKEFNVLEDMFPMIADFKLMGEENYHISEMFGDASAKLTGKRTKVKPGTIESRKPGAEGAIKINALEVIKQHLENSLYMEEMAEYIKTLGDVSNATRAVRKSVNGEMRTVSESILEKEIGDYGLELVKAHIDVLARKGGAEGAQMMGFISFLNRNAGPAALAWKLTSAIIQPSAIGNTAAVIGQRALTGLFEVSHSAQARAFVLDNFPQIRARIGDDIAFRDVADWGWLRTWNFWGWKGLQYLDRWTASGGAMGAYRKYLADHKIPFDWNNPNQEAILYAQRVVNTTQSSSDWKDAVLALSSGKGLVGKREWNRILLKFQSFGLTDFQVYYNYFYRTMAGKTSRSRMQGLLALLAGIMATLYTVQTRRYVFQGENVVAGREDSDDPRLQDSLAEDMTQEVISKYPFMSQYMSVAVYESEPVAMLSSLAQFGRGSWDTFSGTESGYGSEAHQKGIVDFLTGLAGIFGVAGSGQVRSTSRAIIEGENAEPGSGGPKAPPAPEKPKGPKPPKP